MKIAKIVNAVWNRSPAELVSRLSALGRQHQSECQEVSEQRCVFVLSTGRVGSMMLARLLRKSQGLMAVHEPAPNLAKLSSGLYAESPLPNKALLRSVAAAVRYPFVSDCHASGRRYIETSPQGTFLAPAFSALWPGVTYLHLVREPADVLRSAMRRGWFCDGFDDNRIRPRKGSDIASQWVSFSAFEKNCWLWAETNRWILDFRLSLAADQSLLVKSEGLFSGDLETIGKIATFLGIEAPSSRLVKRALATPQNAQKSGSFPLPNDWTEMHKKSYLRFVQPIAKKFNYGIPWEMTI